MGEACDDGDQNANDIADACREDCVLPRCGDGVVDSGEDCDDGDANDNNGCANDCRLGRDGQSAERAVADCSSLARNVPNAADGLYWIDPDGSGAFEAYCDMTTDGGGWTEIPYASDLVFERQFFDGPDDRVRSRPQATRSARAVEF